MRTVFVNPRRRRTKRRNTKRRASTMANPRRRRRTRRTYRRRPTSAAPRRRRRTYRRRRRNAGVAPFVRQNPLILSNPRRRRRRRRNPKLNLKKMFTETAIYFGGGTLGYAVNQFGLSQISNDWGRRASQVLVATAGAYLMKGGSLGASFAGATLYPLIADLAMYTGLVAVPTSDDLLELSADLEDALELEADLEDDELYIDDYEPMYDNELVDW